MICIAVVLCQDRFSSGIPMVLPPTACDQGDIGYRCRRRVLMDRCLQKVLSIRLTHQYLLLGSPATRTGKEYSANSTCYSETCTNPLATGQDFTCSHATGSLIARYCEAVGVF
jgi:hypothetical protein